MSIPSYTSLNNTSYNSGYLANVGWEETNQGNFQLDALFSEENLKTMQKAITRALDGVDPEGRNIIVGLENIASVMSSVYRFSTRPNIGDIHTRYIIPQAELRCDIRSIINQTINIIVSNIKNQTEMETNNKKLTVWSTLYGDFNKEGLRSHAPIKIRRKHPQYMAFQMNY
jgi:hypothetical protein